MPQGLEDDRARLAGAQHVALADVDGAVAHVGHRAGRGGHVAHLLDGEAEVGGQIVQGALCHGPAARIAHGAQRVVGHPFDLLDVVVAAAHFLPQGHGGPASLLDGGGGRGAGPLELGVQAHQVLQGGVGESGRRLQRRQVEALVEGLGLGPLQGDFEAGALVGGVGAQQVGGTHVEGLGQLLHQLRAGLAFAALQHGQERGLLAHPLTQVRQGEAPHPAVVAQALAEHQRIEPEASLPPRSFL